MRKMSILIWKSMKIFLKQKKQKKFFKAQQVAFHEL